MDFNTKTTESTKDEWLTPPEIIKSLGKFDLDPCAPINRPWEMAEHHYTKADDGMSKEWLGRIWLNPPYGKETFKWLAKLAEHRAGLALIFARTETKGFHEVVWNKAHSIFFFKGRIRFYHASGVKGDYPNAPSCLVSYSESDTEALKNSGLNGKLITLLWSK